MASSYSGSDGESDGEEVNSDTDSEGEGDHEVVEPQDAGDFVQELEKENKILESISTIGNVKHDEKLDKMLACVKSVADRILLPSFQDITNMFSSGVIFFVDGDSMLLNLMGDVNYDTNNGGQLLHLIYLCERHLQLFSRMGGNFEVIFFNIWSQAWSGKHTLLLARSALMSHLRFNMSCKVHEFDSVWDVKFIEVLEKCNCSFILTDFQMLDTYCKLYPHEDHVLQELIFHVSICYSLVGLNLGWVDMKNVELTVSTLNAFCCQPGVRVEDVKLRRLLHIIIRTIQNKCRLSVIPTKTGESQLLQMEGVTDVRHIVTVSAAAQFLRDSSAPQPFEDWIRAFLIYSAVLEVLPLRFRGCASSANPTTALTQFVQQLHKHMNRVLQTVLHGSCNVNYNFDTVSDLWHGNLFMFVLTYVAEYDICEEVLLGKQTFSAYERLLQEVVRLAGKPLEKFPITKQKLEFYVNQKAQKKESQKKKLQKQERRNRKSQKKDTAALSLPVQCLKHLIPTNCLLTNEFCRDILPEEEKLIPDGVLSAYITRNSDFTEDRHWHSRKPMSDHFDRIRDTDSGKPTDKYQRRKYENFRNKHARYLAIYGSSIEGRPLTLKSIVCENSTSSKNRHAKSTKQSKKAQKIIDDHIKQSQAKDEESDRQMFKVFNDKYKKFKKKGAYEAALNEAKLLERRLKTRYMLQSILMCKAKIVWHLWQNECRAVHAVSIRNLNYVKEIFLVIRRILREFGNISLSVEDVKQLGYYLWQMGLERIAQCWNLPEPERSTTDQLYSIGVSWIDFQLLYLGPELERESGSKPDNRVEGFVPDAWQIELFDSVDRHQSVLVVAPTSSGKTYASYYCMERVLRESNDGVVVYVAPTKALVNQVVATIYARFKNKTMPPGKSVYGAFTRDYRTNALNSQILVTVPECLELLLLSPRRHDWVRRLRYVIFDEIHCLAGQTGGFSWECCLLLIRCPFLALSATVEDPESLHKWLQNMQSFKEKQDIANGCENPSDFYKVNLVVYKDHHSDLRKFVYCEDGQLHNVHPYAYLHEKLVTRRQRIPENISLSPVEVRDLYSAMKSVCPQDSQLRELNPEIFFPACTSGFISRNMVREFETELKKVLEKWAFKDSEAFKSVVSQLNSVSSSIGSVSEMNFIGNNFVKFILRLQKENMLPAIVFSYDRLLVNYLFSETTKYYEEIAKQYEANKVTSQTKSCIKESERSKEAKVFEGDFVVRKRGHGRNNKYEASLNLLHTGDVKFTGLRNVLFQDQKIVQFVEKRLMRNGHKKNGCFSCGLRNGLGVHFGGMSPTERSAVEMLFRMQMLNLVFATGTLALGIHMPCKTVAVVGDSRFLNSLEFQQMSGRAGRRGFDNVGNVVFMGLNERKIRRLLTDRLPKMVGNFPLSVSMVLRVLLMVSDITSGGTHSDKVTRDALSRALTMLNCCLVYETFPELKPQMKHFFAFSVQLLMLQHLLDNEGKPQLFAGIITHLHYHEPGNLAFVYLLRSGALRMICKPEKDGRISKETQMNLVIVLSYLFAPLILHRRAECVEYINSKVVLPPLPPEIKKVLESYNEEVMYVFDNYFRSVAKECRERMGDDDTLPLSGNRIVPREPFNQSTEGPVDLETYIVEGCEPRNICSAFAALSGHTDRGLYSHYGQISNIRHQVSTDVKVIPIVELDTVYNGYAWDFYNHGVSVAIRRDNGLKAGDDYCLLHDFLLMLTAIRTSLEELQPINVEDEVLRTFTLVEYNFRGKFRKAYGKNVGI